MLKTKILFFMPNLDGGGAERVVTNIIRQLNKDKFDIYLVLVDKYGEYIDLIPHEVTIIDLKAKKISRSFFKLRLVIKRLKPNIIFSSLFTTNVMLYLSSFFLLKEIKLVLRSPNSPKLILENGKMSFYCKFLLESAYKRADYILAQTPEMKKEIHEYHGIKNSKIITFLNPLDKQTIDNNIKNISNMFDETYINVVASGRLHEQKGFDILIKAFKLVVQQNNNFRLFIIGKDKGEEENLLRDMKNLELDDVVKLVGFQKNPYQYYYYSDLFVLSSRWEGLPNTVLENLYLEKRIVATRCIPFMDQLIEDKKNGLLVEVGNINALAEAILNYKLIVPSNRFKTDDVNRLFQDFIK